MKWLNPQRNCGLFFKIKQTLERKSLYFYSASSLWSKTGAEKRFRLWRVCKRGGKPLTFLRGKVVRSLNSSKGYPLEATKSKRTWSLQLPRKRLSRNSPLGVRILSLLICSPDSSSGSGGRACSNDKRIAWNKKSQRFCFFQLNALMNLKTQICIQVLVRCSSQHCCCKRLFAFLSFKQQSQRDYSSDFSKNPHLVLSVFTVNLNQSINSNVGSDKDDDTLSKHIWKASQEVALRVLLQHYYFTLIKQSSCPKNVIKLVALCLTLFPKARCSSEGCQVAYQYAKSSQVLHSFMLPCCLLCHPLEKNCQIPLQIVENPH